MRRRGMRRRDGRRRTSRVEVGGAWFTPDQSEVPQELARYGLDRFLADWDRLLQEETCG